jgi:DnaJ-class molecular chaperone
MNSTSSDKSDKECEICNGSGKKLTNIGDWKVGTDIKYPGPNDPCEHCIGTGKNIQTK